jgi:hypothetical protein
MPQIAGHPKIPKKLLIYRRVTAVFQKPQEIEYHFQMLGKIELED